MTNQVNSIRAGDSTLSVPILRSISILSVDHQKEALKEIFQNIIFFQNNPSNEMVSSKRIFWNRVRYIINKPISKIFACPPYLIDVLIAYKTAGTADSQYRMVPAYQQSPLTDRPLASSWINDAQRLVSSVMASSSFLSCTNTLQDKIVLADYFNKK